MNEKKTETRLDLQTDSCETLFLSKTTDIVMGSVVRKVDK